MKQEKIISYVIGSLFTAFIALPASANTWYVDSTNGSATGSCTESSPCTSISSTNLTAVAGDTIYITGTFSEFNVGFNGTADAPITITAWPDQSQPVLEDTSLTVTGQYLTISSITVQNKSSLSAIVITGASNVTIQDSTFTNNTQVANITNNVSNLTFSNNVFHDNAKGLSIFGGSDVTFSGNEFYDMTSGSSESAINLSAVSTVEIEGNNFHDNDNSGAIITGISLTGLMVGNNFFSNNASSTTINLENTSTGITIVNNSFYDSLTAIGSFGAGPSPLSIDNANIGVTVATQSFTITNNIFHTATIAALAVPVSLILSSDYNDYYNVTSVDNTPAGNYASLADWQTASGFDANSITDDPLFVSTTTGSEDLHLQTTSTMIDTGTDVSSVLTEDKDGESRLFGSATDIGADETIIVAPVTDLALIDSDATTAELSWTYENSELVTSYTVEYDITTDFSNPTASSFLPAEETVLTNLEPRTDYAVRVQVVYTTDYQTYTSEYSDTLEFTTKYAVPGNPKSLQAKKRTENSVLLTWKKPTNSYVKTYTVQKRKFHVKKKAKWDTYNTVTKTQKKVKKLAADSKYEFRVKACNNTGCSAYSAWTLIKRFE